MSLQALQDPTPSKRCDWLDLLRGWAVLVMIEAQIAHVMKLLGELKRTGATSFEPTEAAQRAFVADVRKRSEGTVWTAGGCSSYYLDENGVNSTIWPGFTFTFRRKALAPVASRYLFRTLRPVREPVAAS